MSDNDLTTERKGTLPLIDSTMAALGMSFFALFVHSGWPMTVISACGLLLTTFTVLRGLKAETSLIVILGLHRFSPVTLVCTVLGSLLGVVLGFIYRWGYGLEFLLRTFGQFGPVAALIGATEEFLFRGYIQGRLNWPGPIRAAAFTSLCHTVYKCALFAFPPEAMQINYPFLAIATFMIGIAFGVLRQRSGSIFPPIAAHVCFDIIAYGEYSQPPWWVWS
ncbi:MAG: CPBP family intramembrane glutamic endopeptidase [Thermodesulfobacteriota bacterium]|nr:CPBP family intramembrane glutamic endopeptidase [Thermodesulfobacteriota bacterium]